MMQANSPAPVITDAITDALRTLGTGDGTSEEAGRARVLLETQPPTTLTPVALSLWQTEMASYQKRQKQSKTMISVVIAAVLLFTLVRIFGAFSVAVTRVLTVSFYLPLIFGTVSRKRCDTTPVHKGLLRLLSLRPQAAFVPLLVDALSVVSQSNPVNKDEIRYILTRYLPVWWEQDRTDLTPVQQKILLKEILGVTRGGSIWTRRLGAPAEDMTLADADFALTAITALRHCRATHNESAMRQRLLSQLPAPITENDPRHEIRRAVETLQTIRR